MPIYTASEHTTISYDDTDHYVYGWLNQTFYKMTDDDLFLLWEEKRRKKKRNK